jgi:integrase/recombinase XerD
MKQSRSLTVATPKPPATLDADVHELADLWLVALTRRVKAGELSPATSRTYNIGLGKLIDWCRSERVDLVDADALRDWKAACLKAGAKPGSVNTWFGGIRAFFAWAVASRRLLHNPALEVKAESRSKSRRHKRDALTDDEVRRLLAQPKPGSLAGTRDLAILALMLYGAARTVEAHRANIADVRTEKGKLVIAVQGKGRVETDEVIVLANPSGASYLYDWLGAHPFPRPGQPLFVSLSNRGKGARLSLSAIRELVKTYMGAAGIRNSRKTTHSLRHSAATTALAHGAPITKVQTMLRHANLQTTLTYVHELDRVENPGEQFID